MLRQRRTLFGNISLALVLAIMLTLVPPVGAGGGGTALADEADYDLQFDFPGESGNNLIRIFPVTPTDFSGYNLGLKFKDPQGNILFQVVLNLWPPLGSNEVRLVYDNIYGKIYAQIYNAVYGGVYSGLQLDYVPALGVYMATTPGLVYASIYNNVYYSSPYLDLVLQPPIPALVGDFDKDNDIDFEDLMTFALAWKHKSGDVGWDTAVGGASGSPFNRADIGPASGTPPDLVSNPDGKVDFEDLMVFALMWNWIRGG